jgi:hypothetical protein
MMPDFRFRIPAFIIETSSMAWRIDESVVRGEIDSRVRGRVTGRIWFIGRDEPVVLDLEGNPHRELAGHVLRFSHENPKPGKLDGFFSDQRGVVGDMTASRKVKVPEIPIEEVMRLAKAGQPWPWHWANSLYLEWFSERNGRVVIESSDYHIEISNEASWMMGEAEELAQREQNARALTGFMERLCQVAAADSDDGDFDEDAPQSRAEAEADAEAAYMDRLMDRIQNRIEREGLDEGLDYERIHDEERERLRREMGFPPDPEPTPEQEEERARWIEEMNAAADEALREMEAEIWKDHREPKQPKLLERASELGIRLHHQIDEWLPENISYEHPLMEIVDGVRIASAKIAGAIGCDENEREWPPDRLFAGDSLVRLKKARAALRDALRGIDSADEENLVTPEWRATARNEINAILAEVQRLIAELREVLADDEEDANS